jgi:DNA recombination protein RmuC
LEPAVYAAATAAAAALIAALAALFVALRRGGGMSDRLDRLADTARHLSGAQAELAGRLGQMADQGAASQSHLAERLQAQERQIAKQLEDKLTEVARQVGETLTKNATEAQTSLSDLKTRLAIIDEAQKNIASLSTQVVGLQDILANKQARGALGQVQMEDIVRSILPPSAYAFQATVGGTRRADCLIRLPNPPGPIVIDSKFPLESYQALVAAKEDAARTQAARAFGTDVMKHVRDIAEKYIVAGETAESALMFLPSEAVYAELHTNFLDVVEKSYRARVWIVSPTTLMATLNTVRAVLKDVRMREQASVIQAEVRALLQDVGRLDERVGKLQKHFDQTSEDVRQIRISTEKVTKRGERIEELQLEDGETAEAALAAPKRPTAAA